MNILSVVILYHPDLKHLQKNIDAFLQYTSHLIIWDNSPIQEMHENSRFCYQHYPDSTYIGTGENNGISAALNYAWRFAQEKNYDTLLTMDQDSLFVDFGTYKKRIEQKWSHDGICLCGPTPNLHLNKNLKEGFSGMPDIITSGMLVPVSLLNQCGGYCKGFLVDGIDIELCYHLRENGYKIYRDNESNLIQQFGHSLSKRIYGITVHAHGYSSDRLYHIFRNHLMIWRKYGHPVCLLKKILYDYFLKMALLGILFVENDKGEKLKAVFSGLRDGIKNQNLILSEPTDSIKIE